MASEEYPVLVRPKDKAGTVAQSFCISTNLDDRNSLPYILFIVFALLQPAWLNRGL